jgi:hypothetical protein
MFDSPIVQNQKGYVWMEVKGKLKTGIADYSVPLRPLFTNIVSTAYRSLQASHTN